tara:strand:+ start:578 stop:835 length:258 start_codon:yes stop_codon:yes gene_type:complete
MADETTVLTLNDTTIAQIAKCLQVAILTGTDIADNLRQIQLEVKDGKVGVTDNYLRIFENNIERMLNGVQAPTEPDQDQLKLFDI